MNLSKEHMGLNLPMLLANSQTLDSWGNTSQYSPPMPADRSLTIPSAATTTTVTTSSTSTTTTNNNNNNNIGNGGTLRVQAAYSTTTANNPHELSIGSRSLFGGSSNNSEPTASPHKPMDTNDMEDNESMNAKQERLQGSPRTPECAHNSTPNRGNMASSTDTDLPGSSPIPNVNTNEAHLHIQHTNLRQTLPQHAHATHTIHPPHIHTHSRHMRDVDDLEIKQELVEFFHAAPPLPPASESQRSYSSADELRTSADEYAQDLRVAAAKGLEFGSFVLPRNLRPPRSSPTESLEEKYTPLNMRKLNVSNNSSAASVAAAAAAAGNVLMNSLLSNESLSEENTNNSGRLKRSASQEANAAAALYAESLTNRDDCDFVGSNVTLKLRAMDRTQRIIAEKLISEVLFFGQFNELERSAHIQPK